MNTSEEHRLAALRASGLLDTPAEGRFDRITRIACRLFDVPIASVTLVDQDRQWFKSTRGVHGKREDPREVSFCSRAIERDEMFVVTDASQDERFKENPLVTGEPYIRFYAGRPVSYQGQRIGTLCIIDDEPRELTPTEAQDLEDLALWVESEFDSERLSTAQQELMFEVDRLREIALVDELTHTWNRAGLKQVYQRELSQLTRESEPVGVIMADVDHFKKINDTYGHDVGDIVLERVADKLRLSVRPYDAIGRMGGEEFLVLLPKSHGPTVARIGERIRAAVEAVPITCGEHTIPVTLSLGGAFTRCSPSYAPGLPELAKLADKALYQAKHEGRNRVVLAPELHPGEVAPTL